MILFEQLREYLENRFVGRKISRDEVKRAVLEVLRDQLENVIEISVEAAPDGETWIVNATVTPVDRNVS